MSEQRTVVWLNGPFGGGKTTLAKELSRRWPDAVIFDPEVVGATVQRLVETPTGDYQDLPVWRELVAAMTIRMLGEYERPLIVPMTLVVPEYLREIHAAIRAAGARLHHVFLKTPAEVLEARIDAQSFTPDDPAADEETRVWRRAQIERCAAAVDLLPGDTVLLDGVLPTAELAGQVLELVGAPVR
ncbi:AAA family ATPase [Kitasatospora sp. NPDC101235]|uniref:AAA family ATPase n=1 Tax=Kitasatospora sp. NPDC101235 TaxID=3364101 RepID=UPI0037F98C96